MASTNATVLFTSDDTDSSPDIGRTTPKEEEEGLCYRRRYYFRSFGCDL